MKNYTYQPTQNKDLFRVVDRKGNWNHYYLKSKNQHLRAVNYILENGYAKGVRFVKWLKSKSEEEADRILKETGERGDRIHQFIARLPFLQGRADRYTTVLAEDNLTEVKLSDDEWDAVLSFQEFWKRHESSLIISEYPIYNLKYGYAGTLDLIMRLNKDCGVKICKCKDYIGKIGLIDIKTGGGIYTSYGAQLAAYGMGQNFKEVLGKNKIGYTAALRIGTNHKTTGGYEFDPYNSKETKSHFQRFLAAIDIGNAEYEPFNPEKEIQEISENINIEIKQEMLAEKPKKVAKKSKKDYAKNKIR